MVLPDMVKKPAKKRIQPVKPKRRLPGRAYPKPKGKLMPLPRRTTARALGTQKGALQRAKVLGALRRAKVLGTQKGRLASQLGAVPAKKGK